MKVLELILIDILKSLYSSTIQGFVFAVMSTMIVVYFRREGVKKGIELWVEALKQSKIFMYRFLLFFYSYILAYRTLFSRGMVWSGWSKVLGGWWIEVGEDKRLEYGFFENIILFIPLIFLLFMAFDRNLKLGKKRDVIKKAVAISFMTSVFIEMNQLLFRIGTFQLADLVYNTLGGVLGGLIYILVNLKKYKKQRK